MPGTDVAPCSGVGIYKAMLLFISKFIAVLTETVFGARTCIHILTCILHPYLDCVAGLLSHSYLFIYATW